MAGGGRGKVCTDLYRPCRGDVYEYGTPRVVEDSRVPGKDGLAAPDELVNVEIDVTNVGDEPGKAKLQVECGRCPGVCARVEGDAGPSVPARRRP